MARIALAAHAKRSHALAVARSTAQWLEDEGHSAVLLSDVKPSAGLPDAEGPLDLLVSLGGDGTMLRTAVTVLGTGVPVLGVNFGRFGYLTAVEPDGLRQAVKRFLSGDYQLEARTTLSSSVETKGGPERRLAPALNDVVLAHATGQHTVNARLRISGVPFLSYAADALIVATPTGSTGYNLSARGPIISPKLGSLVVTPVAPHMLFDRSLVLDRSDDVAFELVGPTAADLVVDGAAAGRLEGGERLVCRAGEHDALFVSFGERRFDTVLKNKFHLADR